MVYEAKNYDKLIGMPGFSEPLLRNHFTLYQGYVTNTNKLCDALDALSHEGRQATPEFAELARRFGWEWNGMRLHEYYFDNLAGNGQPSGKVKDALAKDFKDFESFQKYFLAVGAMRGIGWTVLYHDPQSNRFFVSWINEHDGAHLAGCNPILVMDCFEHAFMLDYGVKRADYLAAFWKNVDWAKVESRIR
ncbi:MAG: superoxide dismutase [Deltaproteobacteria bacterium]|nr:superoxide dismutase [Deltaproteobacteria bacterium]